MAENSKRNSRANRAEASEAEATNADARVAVTICEGCEPITVNELYALYMLTGEHPADDEVVYAVRKKLSHTLLDLDLDTAMDQDYREEWLVKQGHRDWTFTANEPAMREQSPDGNSSDAPPSKGGIDQDVSAPDTHPESTP